MDPSADAAEELSPQTQGAALAFPARLLAGYLLFQLLVLAWSAYPAETMKGDQPLQSWAFLAGAQALFVSVIWPMSRLGRGGGWLQAAVEGLLLMLAGLAAAAPAIWWTETPGDGVLSGGGYVLAWTVASGLAVGMAGRVGWAVRWLYAGLMLGANFGLLGMGYLSADLLGGDAESWWRLSPMQQAAWLAETGWPDRLAMQAPTILPVIMVLLLSAAALLAPRRPAA